MRLKFLDLTVTELRDGGGEEAGNLRAERGGQFRGSPEQVVTGEDCPVVAPLCVDAGHAASGGGVIHDVVVVERSDVHELDRTTATDDFEGGRRTGGIEGGSGGHGESGTHTLPARLNQVACDIGEEVTVGGNNAQKLLLGPSKILHHGRQDRQRMSHLMERVRPSSTDRPSSPLCLMPRIRSAGRQRCYRSEWTFLDRRCRQIVRIRLRVPLDNGSL